MSVAELIEREYSFLDQFRKSTIGQLFNEDTTGGFISDNGVRHFCNRYENPTESYIQAIQYLQSMGAVMENTVGRDYWILRNEINLVDRSFDPELYSKAEKAMNGIRKEVEEREQRLRVVE
ncbi:hypothetical protein HN681_04285 [archaeon]|jgi:hypothetical protein|nr:hypothetical protein [archaeon]MBT3730935.1 hypothetical protein [archaeon]MBT4669826.1 hypothetical protein [archaeon]MBT5029977.1 hypothetical protein [archaeon]MBT5288079.1 hypothetical protein [archaeon]